ncbi:MAG: hypothetical protein NTX87_02680 [Planctomycetota bacterium]|nr:hypothetical protein [Planctomycetota bacterium]
MFEHHKILTEVQDPFEAGVFNVYQNGARMLLASHPLDRVRIIPEDPRAVHLIVVGLGQMGESVAVQAAQVGHFANGKKLRISVIDRRAAEKKNGFYSRYPQFDRVADTVFLNGDLEAPEVLEKMRKWANDQSAITTVAVCLDDDSRSLSAALTVLAKLVPREVPVVVRMSEEAGLATLLEGGEGSPEWLARIHAFGMIDRVCTSKMLLDEERDTLAMAIHRDFNEKRRARSCSETDPAMRSWERLDQGLKDSYRRQADHIPVKLRAIGCYGAPARGDGLAVDKSTPDQMELLARMEHTRMTAERLLSGWTQGPHDYVGKSSPHLVPWEELPEDVKEDIRQAVRTIPNLLELVGERTVLALNRGGRKTRMALHRKEERVCRGSGSRFSNGPSLLVR